MSNSVKRIKMKDSRTLTFYEFGDVQGKPVFYFHGAGVGSGHYAKSYHIQALRNGIRLIAPDRPGIGASEFKEKRALLEWPDDVMNLADSLSINKFSIISESGGSAYAFACAYKIPELIEKVCIVSGLCPLDNKALRKGLRLKSLLAIKILMKAPDWVLGKMYGSLFSKVLKDADKFFANKIKSLSSVDKEILADPVFQKVYTQSLLNVYSQGNRSMLQDLKICSSSWGFEPSEVEVEINLWHGEKDEGCPVLMIKRFEQLLKDCKAVYYPDDTHLSVLQRHSDEIFSFIAGKGKTM